MSMKFDIDSIDIEVNNQSRAVYIPHERVGATIMEDADFAAAADAFDQAASEER